MAKRTSPGVPDRRRANGEGSIYHRTSDDRWVGSAYVYTTTGLHGLHVSAGLLSLLILLLLAQSGQFKHGRGAIAVDTISLYWHFVDGVWIVLFSTIYLWSLFG